MRFVKPTINLRKPQEYLRAGLPVVDLDSAESLLGRRVSGSAEEHSDADPNVFRQRTAGRVVVDENQQLCGLEFDNGWPVLIDPPNLDLLHRDRVISARRSTSGMIEVDTTPGSGSRAWGPRAAIEDPRRTGKIRPVTVDASVFLVGLRTALFAPTDRLFVSAAVLNDVNLMLRKVASPRQGHASHGVAMMNLDRTILPVPVGSAIQKTLVYNDWSLLLGDLDLTEGPLGLWQSDLYAAATAIVYDAPLYTTRPEAYERLKGGLRVIEYGPVRFKYDGWEKRADLIPVAFGGPSTYKSIAELWGGRSNEPEATLDTRTRSVCTFNEFREREGADALANAIASRLESWNVDTDATWLHDLLDDAPHIAELVSDAGDEAYRNLMNACWMLTRYDDAGAAVADFEARADGLLAAVGRWPQELNDDFAYDLENDDDFASRWYGVFLAMAGVTPDVVAEELAAFAEGRVAPSRARIDELARG